MDDDFGTNGIGGMERGLRSSEEDVFTVTESTTANYPFCIFMKTRTDVMLPNDPAVPLRGKCMALITLLIATAAKSAVSAGDLLGVCACFPTP